MPASLSELLHDWHDFYVLAGSASATLTGLMFVAASIGSSILNEEHRAPTNAFLTPTVVHFAAVLFVCLLVTIPSQSWRTLGGLLGAGGLGGSIYCGRIVVQMMIRRTFDLDLIDRLFYALIPCLGYLLVLMSAVLLLIQSTKSADLLAAGLLTLLGAGIRNAWDLTVSIMIRVPNSKAP